MENAPGAFPHKLEQWTSRSRDRREWSGVASKECAAGRAERAERAERVERVERAERV